MTGKSAPILLTYVQTAELLGISDRTVWTLVNTGELPAVRLAGRTVRIDRRDLDQFIARCKENHDKTLPREIRDDEHSGHER